MAAEVPRVALPGDKLGAISDYKAGPGTYEEGGEIFSALWGSVKLERIGTREEISVWHGGSLKETQSKKMLAPRLNSIVTARITNTNPKFCRSEIIAVESKFLLQPFHGIIRSEDVRATEKDSVDLYKSYRPGDIVCARVIALGDAQSYVLSTAENELGVVHAVGEAGVAMVPISWCQMQCPETGKLVYRKVAKVKEAVSIQEYDM